MVIAWHIYFTTYGTWLHGDPRGSRDKDGPLPPDPLLEKRRRDQLTQNPFTLTDEMRERVDQTIREVCEYKRLNLYALNVRTNHVHLVIGPHAEWWKLLKAIKAHATKALRKAGLVGNDQKVWTARGGRKRLETEAALREAIEYVLYRQ